MKKQIKNLLEKNNHNLLVLKKYIGTVKSIYIHMCICWEAEERWVYIHKKKKLQA